MVNTVECREYLSSLVLATQVLMVDDPFCPVRLSLFLARRDYISAQAQYHPCRTAQRTIFRVSPLK
jgi:hypothetical protein